MSEFEWENLLQYYVANRTISLGIGMPVALTFALGSVTLYR